jgi:hypothetical protein
MKNMIWAASGLGLGDCWASVNYILRKSIENNKIEQVSHYYKKGNKKRNYYKKVNEIINLIESSGRIKLVNEDPTDKLTWKDVYKIDYFNTKVVWKNNNSNNVCYQFDGKSHNCKNMNSKEEEDKIIETLIDSGFNHVRLGGHLSLEENIELLSKCEFFIGVESGFAHIACSVGTPIFMVVNGRTYQGVKDSHENRTLLLCKDYLDAISSIHKYLKDKEYYNKYKELII